MFDARGYNVIISFGKMGCIDVRTAALMVKPRRASDSHFRIGGSDLGGSAAQEALVRQGRNRLAQTFLGQVPGGRNEQ